MRLITLGVVTLLALTFVALVNTSVQADVENPSFEIGDTSGWTESLNGGTIEVVQVCDTGCAGSPFSPYDPIDGDEFALLSTTGGSAALFQTISIMPGATISGWAFFCDAVETPSCFGEFDGLGFCDPAAEVRISDGDTLNVPVFSASSCQSHTDWTAWTLVVPGEDCGEVTLTIAASVAYTGGVPGGSNRLGLDAIVIDDEEQAEACATPTPSPSPSPTQEPRLEAVRQQPPNIGAGLSGLFQGQPTQLPTAPSVAAPAATAPAITPPRTGDGGLR